jgi:hypothetical protein
MLQLIYALIKHNNWRFPTPFQPRISFERAILYHKARKCHYASVRFVEQRRQPRRTTYYKFNAVGTVEIFFVILFSWNFGWRYSCVKCNTSLVDTKNSWKSYWLIVNRRVDVVLWHCNLVIAKKWNKRDLLFPTVINSHFSPL